MSKSLQNTCINDITKNVKDTQFWGDGDTFKLISKASSQEEGWMKSTKCLDYGAGVVLQVTTQQRNPDESYSLVEAVTNVSGVTVIEDTSSNGTCVSRRLVPIEDV